MKDQDKKTKDFINNAYESAMSSASGRTVPNSKLSHSKKANIDIIVKNAESSKAAMTVILTSLVYKCLYPNQDVRKHQSSIKGGYSGRTFDTHYITPFLKRNKFPSMTTSGWLTRSFEQKVPYDFNYTGAIKPNELKNAFLNVMSDIEDGKNDEKLILDYLLQSLIIQRDTNKLNLAIPQNLSINDIVSLLDKHFHNHYKASGASRLPVLALYAIYTCLINDNFSRYKGKKLLSLEKHNSADTQSGRIGDIDIVDENDNPFEAVEVKFDIQISHDIVIIAKDKILPTKAERYYILSTKDIKESDKDIVEQDIKQLKNIHGCQLIINGVMQTIKYYLRLMPETSTFLNIYTQLLNTDDSIKFEHKNKWNDLISNL
ncbi:MAG: hypothetical protein J6T48_09265 [Bacteroidales bacterium]|nr:hypothetical protein [Bacteroidales bacterium]